MTRNIKITEGDIFGSLKIIRETSKFVQPSGQKQRGFLCECCCGKTTKVRLSHLRFGQVLSCGCLSGETHKQSGSRLYNTWRGMKNRCYGNKTIKPHIYKDRGIRVCPEWNSSFLSFMNWALSNGYKEGLQIDRRDNDGNYEPSNCRFVTNRVNSNNRRDTFYVIYHKKKHALSLLLHSKGISKHYPAIFGRIKRGWAIDRAIDTPIRKGNYRRNI